VGKRKKEKNKKNKKMDLYRFIGIILILSSLLLLGVVVYINILPIKYLAILVGVLLFLNLIFNFFLFRKKIKKKPKKIVSVFSILFSILFIVGSFFIYKTFGVLDDMSQKYKIYTYHVVVLNDSSYKDITDLSDESLGYYNDNSEVNKKALSKLGTVVTTENKAFGNLESFGSSVLEEEVAAIVVEDSRKMMLDTSGNNESSENPLSGFSGKTRILYTFKVKAKPESKDVNVTKDVFNIYISGMDEYGEVSEISRSDVNMILTINPKTKQILLTNIPRDYYVQLHDTTGYKDKLTHAGIYGIDTSIKTLEDLLGIEINYYFKVNFSSLENIIDALGGVDVYSEYTFQTWNGYNFSEGYNHVDGKAALAFSRERKTFQDGDNQRGKNQQAMIEAIFRKVTSPEIITKYNSLLNSLKDSMITNMPTKSMTSLAKMQLRDNAKWIITSNSLTGTGSYEYTYTYPYQELYVMIPDEEVVSSGQELISKVASDQKLESSYSGDSSDVHSVTKSFVSKGSTTKKDTKKKEEVKKEKVKKEEPLVEDVVDDSLEDDSNDTIIGDDSNSSDSSTDNTTDSGINSDTSGETVPDVNENDNSSSGGDGSVTPPVA